MTDLEQVTLATLRQLDEAVRSGTEARSQPDLPALFKKLDDLAKRLPADTDPNLRHYLQRKSYRKARLLLEDCGAEDARGARSK